jgi:hypothetical protein
MDEQMCLHAVSRWLGGCRHQRSHLSTGGTSVSDGLGTGQTPGLDRLDLTGLG